MIKILYVILAAGSLLFTGSLHRLNQIAFRFQTFDQIWAERVRAANPSVCDYKPEPCCMPNLPYCGGDS